MRSPKGMSELTTSYSRSVPKSFKCHLIDDTRQTKIHFQMPNLCLGVLKLDTVRAGEVRKLYGLSTNVPWYYYYFTAV